MSSTNGDRPTLILPRVSVTLDDGRTFDVQILNADLLRWDRTAARHKWPHFETVRAWHSTFVAWSAMRREGLIPSEWTFDDFSDEHCVQIAGIGRDGQPTADDEDAEEGTEIAPFRPAAVPE